MKIKSQRDFWSGVMFIVVGVSFAIGATNYSMGVAARPGPGYFPLILSTIMSILGLIVLFKSLTVETPDGDRIGSIAWRPLIVVVLAIVTFGVLLPRLGMLVTIPVLIVITSFASEEFSWVGVVGAAVVLTVASYLIFIVGLKLTIPVWPSFMA